MHGDELHNSFVAAPSQHVSQVSIWVLFLFLFLFWDQERQTLRWSDSTVVRFASLESWFLPSATSAYIYPRDCFPDRESKRWKRGLPVLEVSTWPCNRTSSPHRQRRPRHPQTIFPLSSHHPWETSCGRPAITTSLSTSSSGASTPYSISGMPCLPKE